MYKNLLSPVPAKRISRRFNPCFNGSMYKNTRYFFLFRPTLLVSILVLMDLCIKTMSYLKHQRLIYHVSILVLMDLCIKTFFTFALHSMKTTSFNPCFNGSMYKNRKNTLEKTIHIDVSILVLMDLCIKTNLR